MIVPVTTALYRLTPVEYLAGRSFFFKQGEQLAPDALRGQLVTAGYAHVTQVVAPGEYCVRGGLIDLFPMGSALPYRIELDDDVVESIRSFDVDTQRSIYKVNEVRLLPAREFPLDEEAQTRFRRVFREKFEGDPSRSRIYKDVSKGVPASGIEYYLPLFFDKTALITDYLPPDTVICAAGRPPGGGRAILERHPRPLRHAARRPRPPGAAAARTVPDRRRVLRRHQALRPRRTRSTDGRITNHESRTHRIITGHGGAAAAGRRTPRRRPAAPAAVIHRRRSRAACWCWRKARAGARPCSSTSA